MSKSKQPKKQLEIDEPDFSAPQPDSPQPNLSQQEIFESQLEYLATVKSYLEIQLAQCDEAMQGIVEQLKLIED